MFQDSDTGDNVVVQKINQKVTGGKLSNYQLNSITEVIIGQYKDEYDAEAEQIGKEEVKINEKNVTKITYKVSIYNEVIYQELNIFVVDDAIYDIIFTKISENGFPEEEKNEILKSFVIKSGDEKDETISDYEDYMSATDAIEIKSTWHFAWMELGILMLVIIILIVIAIKRNPKSKLYILSIVLLIIQGFAFKIEENQNGSLDNVTESIVNNIIYLLPVIISIVLLIIQITKKNKDNKQENIKEKEEEILKEEPKNEDLPKEKNDDDKNNTNNQ